MLQILLGIYKWIVVVPVVGVSTLVFGWACLVLCLVMSPEKAGRWCGRTWARCNAYAALMGVAVEGSQHIDPQRSCVVVANHQSQLDILVVYGWLNMDFRWVMKKELRKVPVLGVCCEKIGHVYIDRSDLSAARAALDNAKEKITGGTSIFFFPEGTRSRNGNLLPFKKGAFKMALDLKLPVLPVSIAGTHGILPPGTMRLKPGRVKLIVHPPVETAGYDATQIPALMTRCRETIESVL